MGMYQMNNAKLAHLLGILEVAAPWLLVVAGLVIITVLLIGRERIRKACLDFPVGEAGLGFGLFLQALALTGIWGSALLPQ